MPLPVETVYPAIRASLAAGRDAILTAPPGSGKTTGVPLALLREESLRGRRILILEPRRVAARAAACRMAELLGEAPGETVGYHVRLERRESSHTRILVLTEGLLARRLLSDPELADAGLVIFDEFHERNLQADFSMALFRDAQRALRPDLRMLVMSATLDAEPIAALLGNCDVHRAEGRMFPVETIYAPPLNPSESVGVQAARASLRALSGPRDGVLAFLPGEGEIRTAERWLLEQPSLPPNTLVLPLYGMLDKAQQDAVLRPAPDGFRKIVLSTSIAESSLTIDGITAVVDSGLMRVSRFSPATGMERLETLRLPRDRADQRRGRAGRLGPGRCFRLWDEATDRSLPPAVLPEILTADLAPLVLMLADWGSSDADSVPWVTPPPAAAWEQARGLLRDLGALDSRNAITPHGRRIARLPMHPRLAHAILLAADSDCLAETCLAAAILAEHIAPAGPPELRHADFDHILADVLHGHDARYARARRLAEDWRRIAERERSSGHRRGEESAASPAPMSSASALAAAFPDRIARRRGGEHDLRYLLACGRGASLRKDDPLSRQEWIVVAELDDANADAAIRLAAALPPADVERIVFARSTRREELAWDARRKAVSARECETFGSIVLRERPLANASPEAVAACLCDGIRTEGLDRLDWTPAASQLRGRLALLHRLFPERGWSAVDDDTLLATLEDWLGPSLVGMKSLEDAARASLVDALLSPFDYARRRELDRLAPVAVAVPSGSHIRIDYTDGDTPVLAVRIQEVFGMPGSPVIAEGRVALKMHLLSPARRPVQITSDLASFWKNGYAECRKDLRGRYPKHYWPEDPAAAVPTRKLRPPTQ